MQENVLIKASGAIHISHRITLSQLKAWNLLLALAYDNLKKQDLHVIPLIDLYCYFGTRSQKAIKRILLGLSTRVDFNLLKKDKTCEWGYFHLLESSKIKKGMCYYRFNNDLIKLLHNPKVYTKINLAFQKKFSSKYSLFLYELCIDYIGVGQSPTLSLELFRDYMGLDELEYNEFKSLSRYVIDKSVKEVNAISDIDINVCYQSDHNKKQVNSLKFSIKRKDRQIAVDNQHDNLDTSSSFVPAVSESKHNLLCELTATGIMHKKAEYIINFYDEKAIYKALSMLKNTMAKPKSNVTNPAGWIIESLRQTWSYQEYDVRKIREEKIRLEEKKKEELNKLQKEHNAFMKFVTVNRYDGLPITIKSDLDKEHDIEIKGKQRELNFTLPDHVLKELKMDFLMRKLLEKEELNFDAWAQCNKKVVPKL